MLNVSGIFLYSAGGIYVDTTLKFYYFTTYTLVTRRYYSVASRRSVTFKTKWRSHTSAWRLLVFIQQRWVGKGKREDARETSSRNYSNKIYSRSRSALAVFGRGGEAQSTVDVSVRRLLYHRGARGHHSTTTTNMATTNHWKCSYFYTTRAHSFADVVVGWLADVSFELSILLVIPIIL